MLASYLGVSPKTISWVRKKLSRKPELYTQIIFRHLSVERCRMQLFVDQPRTGRNWTVGFKDFVHYACRELQGPTPAKRRGAMRVTNPGRSRSSAGGKSASGPM